MDGVFPVPGRIGFTNSEDETRLISELPNADVSSATTGVFHETTMEKRPYPEPPPRSAPHGIRCPFPASLNLLHP
jgi:hypothetical protein